MQQWLFSTDRTNPMGYSAVPVMTLRERRIKNICQASLAGHPPYLLFICSKGISKAWHRSFRSSF
jgi:hypothetical protein